MKKLMFLLLVPIMLTGCEEVWVTDQNKRQELFKQCMQLLPAGPVSTQYNDWDEVVSQCDTVAYYQSKRCVENCAGEVK